MVNENGEEIIRETGESLAQELGSQLEKPLASVQTISNIFSGLIESGYTPRRENANIMLRQLFVHNPDILTSWMYWEKNAFDGKDEQFVGKDGSDHTGRFVPYWQRSESGELYIEPFEGYDEGVLGENFRAILESGKPMIMEPYSYVLDGKEVLMTSIAAPVIVNGKGIGITGVDIALDKIDDLISEYTFYETGFAGLISNEGIVISHENKELLGTNYFESSAMITHEANDRVKRSVLEGKQDIISGYSNVLQTDVYRLFTPIEIEGIDTPWSAFLAVPLKEITEEADKQVMIIVTICIIITIVLTILILLVTRTITIPIREVVTIGENMAKRDFSTELNEEKLKRKDEIGELLKIFQTIGESMREVIGRIQESSNKVFQGANVLEEGSRQSASAASEVAHSIEEVSKAAEEQMQSAEESAKAMENMSEGVQQVADSASVVAEKANDMDEKVKEGQTSVSEAIIQMEKIQEETKKTKAVITQLKDGAEHIEQIVAMITSISEQTELLALNAAIEAARAGEAGKGFAVVAEEVRKLADETKESAMEIQQIVQSIQSFTSDATHSMDANELEVNEGMNKISVVSDVFKQIVFIISEVVEEIESLATTSEQMSAMSQEVLAASEEIANGTQVASSHTQQVAAAAEEQLATTEEILSTSQSLKQLANDLNRLLKQFTV